MAAPERPIGAAAGADASSHHHPPAAVEGKSLTDPLSIGFRGVATPNHIAELLTNHHHISVASLTFPTATVVCLKSRKTVHIASRRKYAFAENETESLRLTAATGAVQ